MSEVQAGGYRAAGAARDGAPGRANTRIPIGLHCAAPNRLTEWLTNPGALGGSKHGAKALVWYKG